MCTQDFVKENLKRRTKHRGRIILRWILKELDGTGVDWIHLPQVGDKWLALLKTVWNFQFPKDLGNFLSI